MHNSSPDPEFKSAERLAFEIYLRTGRRPDRRAAAEHKFNPYHDPRNGQFTFAPGGPRSGGAAVGSDPRGVWKPKKKPANADARNRVDKAVAPALDGSALDTLPTKIGPGAAQLANRGGRGPRRGRGSGGRRQTDPTLLDELFPGLSKSPAGSIIKLADFALDLSTGANEVTREVHRSQVRRLVAQIREIDPDYRFRSLGEPQTLEGRVNEIKALRFDRAVAFYRERGEFRPLQVEVLRLMQERADSAYEEAVSLYESGDLRPRLNRGEAIGNYVDRAVKRELQQRFNLNRVDYSAGQRIRVQGREYYGSGSERRYRLPDARVDDLALDASIREKTLRDEQVQGYFKGDFKPAHVAIVRPTQLGGSYLISRP